MTTTELPPARVVRDRVRPTLRAAPRRVPMRLVWRLWFGAPLAMFGWMFAAGGMVIAFGAVPRIELRERSYDRTAVATVTSVRDDDDDDSTRRVVAYTFPDDDGVARSGESVTVDRNVRPGASYEVRYSANAPSRSVLDGMRSSAFGVSGLLVLIFPIAGIAIALPRLRTGRRDVRLLRHGCPTVGRLIGKAETGTSLNGQPEIAVTFEYRANGRTYRTVVKTIDPAALEDDLDEPMVFDPRAPERATTLDHLPGAVAIAANGELECKPGLGLHVVIFPVITAALIAGTLARML